MSITRRCFCAYSSGTVISATLTACNTSNASCLPSEGIPDALIAIQHKLATELHDDALAKQVSEMIYYSCLIAQPKECSVSEVNSILAFAFGNRPNIHSGNSTLPGEQEKLADPGPTNEKLADAAYELFNHRPVTIYAQWEIARLLESKYKLTNVVSIEPIFTPEGKIEYLSTFDVAQQAVNLAKGAANLGTCAVIGHHDHVRRCVMTAESCGIRAFKPAGITLPTEYDLESGQVWTRSRTLYIPIDLAARLQMAAQQNITDG